MSSWLWKGIERYKKRKFVVITLLLSLMCFSAYAETVIPSELDRAVSEAVLDGCAGLGFLYSFDEPLFEVLVESHETLDVEQNNDLSTVWLLASAGVFRQNDDGVLLGPASANMPIRLVFRHNNDDYTLVHYDEPTGGTWAGDIRTLFPDVLWEKAFAGNADLFESLEPKAEAYFANLWEDVSFRTPIAADSNDPALKAIMEAFGRYPQWEGRCILTRSQEEQLWFYTSIDGDNGYYSPCTFEKYDKNGKLLSRAVVQYKDGQLVLLDGEFPPWDE